MKTADVLHFLKSKNLYLEIVRVINELYNAIEASDFDTEHTLYCVWNAYKKSIKAISDIEYIFVFENSYYGIVNKENSKDFLYRKEI